MFNSLSNSTHDPNVGVSRLAASYTELDDENVKGAVRSVSELLGWGSGKRGAFGNIITEGSRVVIKPNFVLHANQGKGGILPLITHPALVVAAVEEALKAHPSEVLVGDAPIQSCNFDELLRTTRLEGWTD
jgi:uncharacterized protein (DUF362 family)